MSYMDVVSVASDVLLPQHLCVLTLESHYLSSASFRVFRALSQCCLFTLHSGKCSPIFLHYRYLYFLFLLNPDRYAVYGLAFFSIHLRISSDCGHFILFDRSELSSLSWEVKGSGYLQFRAGASINS